MRLGDTPVPIPNTTVKTQAADDTLLETARESRWLPVILRKTSGRVLTYRPEGSVKGADRTVKRDACHPRHGGVAQLGEHLPCKQGVMSSNLTISIILCDRDRRFPEQGRAHENVHEH